MDSEMSRLTNLFSEFQDCVSPESQAEIVNPRNPSISQSMLPDLISADDVASVSTQTKNEEAQSTSLSNSTEVFGKLEDVDEAGLSVFIESTLHENENKVLQVAELNSPRIDSQLTVAEPKVEETHEFAGKVKIEDIPLTPKLEFMDDEAANLGLAIDSSSETLDNPLVPGSNLELKLIVNDSPRKRRRVLLDSIEISTPQWLLPHLDRKWKETQMKREKEFLNPKFKIKRPKEAVQEGLGSVFRRVDALSIKPFPLPAHLDRDFLDFTVCREFTSSVYGGNPQQTFPVISQENQARHPYRNFMYLNLIYDPYAPQRPGHPGLFYRSHTSELPEEHRVLIRIQHGVWLYLGQYELIPAAPLTKEEWAAKSNQTKEKWCTKISFKQWGKSMRVRIALRRSLGREPTPQEIEAGDGLGVSPDDVRRALDSGIEVLQVLVMKCIGYDEGFQRDMRDKRSTWTPPPKPEKEKSTKKRRADKVKKEETTSNEDVNTIGRMTASVHGPAKPLAADETQVDFEPDDNSIGSKELSSGITSSAHGIKRKRQDSATSTSDTVIPATGTPAHRPQRVRRLPSRYLLQ